MVDVALFSKYALQVAEQMRWIEWITEQLGSKKYMYGLGFYL